MSKSSRFERKKEGRISIERAFNDEGALISEIFGVPGKITFARNLRVDNTWEESYFVRGKVSSSKKYELNRIKFPELPKSSEHLNRWKVITDDLDSTSTVAPGILSSLDDPLKAKEKNDFCLKVLQEEENISGLEFMKFKSSLLGTYTSRASKSYLKALYAFEALSIHVWGITRNSSNEIFGDGLVIELPPNSRQRIKILKKTNKEIQKQGFLICDDIGQKFEYVPFG